MWLEAASESPGEPEKAILSQQVAMKYPRGRLCLPVDGLTIITDYTFA